MKRISCKFTLIRYMQAFTSSSSSWFLHSVRFMCTKLLFDLRCTRCASEVKWHASTHNLNSNELQLAIVCFSATVWKVARNFLVVDLFRICIHTFDRKKCAHIYSLYASINIDLEIEAWDDLICIAFCSFALRVRHTSYEHTHRGASHKIPYANYK